MCRSSKHNEPVAVMQYNNRHAYEPQVAAWVGAPSGPSQPYQRRESWKQYGHLQGYDAIVLGLPGLTNVALPTLGWDEDPDKKDTRKKTGLNPNFPTRCRRYVQVLHVIPARGFFCTGGLIHINKHTSSHSALLGARRRPTVLSIAYSVLCTPYTGAYRGPFISFSGRMRTRATHRSDPSLVSKT